MYVKALNIKRLLQEPKLNLANELNCRHYCVPGESPENIYTHYSANIYVSISVVHPFHPSSSSAPKPLPQKVFKKTALHVNNDKGKSFPKFSSILTAAEWQFI